MTESQVVQHINVGQRYRIKIERAASTKGVEGFSVEVNGDDLAEVEDSAKILYNYARVLTQIATPGPLEPDIKPKEGEPWLTRP